MLTNNLSTILGSRKLKITRVSSDTGIARSTLSTLMNEESKMIQFDTVNNLCTYLDIEPKDFFVYSPFDFVIDIETTEISSYVANDNPFDSNSGYMGLDEYKADIFIKVLKYQKQVETFELSATLVEPIQTNIMDTEQTVKIDIVEDAEHKFSNFWNDENLGQFYFYVSSNFHKLLSDKIIEDAKEEAGISQNKFQNWNINASLPIRPF